MFDRIRTLVRDNREGSYYECRHCGAAVDGPGETCPHCDTAEIARYTV